MVDLVSVGLGAIATLIATALGYEYRRHRNRSTEDTEIHNEWYIETAELAAEVQSVWQGKYVRPNERGTSTSFDEVKKEMKLLAKQLSRHCNKTKDLDVDEEVINAARATADACRDVAQMRIYIGSGDKFKNFGETAVEEAQRLEEKASKHIS